MSVRRDISSIPQRSAQKTWAAIINLITGTDSREAAQLSAAAGVMASIITDEHPGSSPLVVEGVGPQLRLYCRYAMSAVEEGDVVDALNWNPTAGDWTMHVPCDSDNLAWVAASLAKTSPRIKPFDFAVAERADEPAAAASATKKAIVIDWNVRK